MRAEAHPGQVGGRIVQAVVADEPLGISLLQVLRRQEPKRVDAVVGRDDDKPPAGGLLSSDELCRVVDKGDRRAGVEGAATARKSESWPAKGCRGCRLDPGLHEETCQPSVDEKRMKRTHKDRQLLVRAGVLRCKHVDGERVLARLGPAPRRDAGLLEEQGIGHAGWLRKVGAGKMLVSFFVWNTTREQDVPEL